MVIQINCMVAFSPNTLFETHIFNSFGGYITLSKPLKNLNLKVFTIKKIYIAQATVKLLVLSHI